MIPGLYWIWNSILEIIIGTLIRFFLQEMTNSFNNLLITLTIFDTTFIVFMLFDYTSFRGNSSRYHHQLSLTQTFHVQINFTFHFPLSLLSFSFSSLAVAPQPQDSCVCLYLPQGLCLISSLYLILFLQVPLPTEQHRPLLLHLLNCGHRLREVRQENT